MPTNPTLPTLAEALEEVKRQDWEHDCGGDRVHCPLCNEYRTAFVLSRSPAPNKQAVAKALRWAYQEAAYWTRPLSTIRGAADAIEKELK